MKIITEYFLMAIFLTLLILYITRQKPKIIIKSQNIDVNQCHQL